MSSFYDEKLHRQRRVEHWEHAQVTGRLAGENMTGAGRSFWHQSAFYSVFAPNATIEAVGLTDSSLDTVSVLLKKKEDSVSDRIQCLENRVHGISFRVYGISFQGIRGVVFYMEARRIVGVLLFNGLASRGIDVARRLIDEAREHEDFKQLAKLFELGNDDVELSMGESNQS